MNVNSSVKYPLTGVMAHSHCTGTGQRQVQGMGPTVMGTDMLHRNVHTGPKERERNQDPLFSIVLVQFPVAVRVPFPCSVNQP